MSREATHYLICVTLTVGIMIGQIPVLSWVTFVAAFIYAIILRYG